MSRSWKNPRFESRSRSWSIECHYSTASLLAFWSIKLLSQEDNRCIAACGLDHDFAAIKGQRKSIVTDSEKYFSLGSLKHQNLAMRGYLKISLFLSFQTLRRLDGSAAGAGQGESDAADRHEQALLATMGGWSGKNESMSVDVFTDAQQKLDNNGVLMLKRTHKS